MVELLLKVLGAGLQLWDDELKDKYTSKLLALQERYYVEINKPDAARSDAVLDNLEFELRLLGSGFASAVVKPNPTNQS